MFLHQKGEYMNYQSFVSSVKEKIETLLEPNMSVNIQTTLKNNNRERIGITISNQNTNIFPTIYLEEYYIQYLAGRPVSDIAENIVNIYHEVKFETSWDINQIKIFDQAKSKIAYRLIHFEKNRKLLNDLPFIPYHDLAIVFYLLIEKTSHGSASILITNDLLQSWNISLSELYQFASQNTPHLLAAELIPMHAMIQELSGETEDPELPKESHMFILTNTQRYFGAACILYSRVLEDIGNQLNEDFYVLPSSIHETIILPLSKSSTPEMLNEMINAINQTQVVEEEVLSNHAYYYSRKENRLLQIC